MSVNASHTSARTAFLDLMRDRILVLDGAMGTMIQEMKLDEQGYRGARFDAWNREVRGNNDLLNLSRPDAIRDIHYAYYKAGADIVSTNTFSSTSIAQADYGLSNIAYELNCEGARLAREAANKAAKEDGRPRFVAGAIGPTNRTASISPDVANPGFRAITFDQLREAYGEQVRGLLTGGADLLLIETIFDTLNAKAAIYAIAEQCEQRGVEVPVMISGTITDRSGRLLSGQTPEAFWNAVQHAAPVSVGLNCALGAEQMRAHIAELARVCDTLICAYPNAGLPNEFGHYHESPEDMARHLGEFADTGLINIVGGCCGTTPEHISAIAEAEPYIARVPVMVDSSKFSVIETGLKCIQGKPVVNSISMKEGEAEFIRHAKMVRRYGAAVVVMAFDEQGQADTVERKVAICKRAYDILVRQVGFSPHDIIFDPNIFAVATGIEEHNGYGVAFIEGTRQIRESCACCHVSGGVSNLSFAFRGNERVREAMHSVFLYHAIKAGMDMGIVNAGQTAVYDDLELELREACEDVVLNRGPDAAGRVLTIAQKFHGAGKEHKAADPAWREWPVEKRLSHALVHGVTDYIVEDTEAARQNADRAVS